MRISFMGSTPFPISQEQSGTCMLVELGNGTNQPRRFFFDLGGGSIRNVIAMQVPIALVNDIFISHLHVDHYADLPLTYAFRAFLGGFTPLRIYGPSGRTPDGSMSNLPSLSKSTCSSSSFPHPSTIVGSPVSLHPVGYT